MTSKDRASPLFASSSGISLQMKIIGNCVIYSIVEHWFLSSNKLIAGLSVITIKSCMGRGAMDIGLLINQKAIITSVIAYTL